MDRRNQHSDASCYSTKGSSFENWKKKGVKNFYLGRKRKYSEGKKDKIFLYAENRYNKLGGLVSTLRQKKAGQFPGGEKEGT